MRLSLSKFLLVVTLLVVCGRGAAASLHGDGVDTVVVHDTLYLPTAATQAQLSKYERRIRRYERFWQFLIPKQVVVQYAGNMGLISVGVGWDYGHHRPYETQLLFGYLPKYNSGSAKMTMTIKQNFIPWHVPIDYLFTFDPLTTGIYFNTVFGSEFWQSQPKRYPDSYYDFLSTRVRVNVFVGQRLSVTVPDNRRKFIKGLTAFYEVSTCDLYIRAMIQDSKVSLWDVIGLSLGVKFQLL